MKRNHMHQLIVYLAIILTSFTQDPLDRKETVFPSPDLMGRDFVPTKINETAIRIPERFLEAHVPTDLSDWERLKRCDELEIESVRVFGSQKLSERFSLVDENVRDSIYLPRFKEAISSKYVMRPCESDVGRSFGAYGGGVYVGVLQFRFKDTPTPLIVGVGEVSFYLDVWYGSNRQAFYSNALATVLSKFLSEKTGSPIPPEMFNQISGKSHFEFKWSEQ